MSILETVNKPDDFKNLNINELKVLCKELRSYIIKEVSENPGHLGANLGVIELTVALHYVFDTPNEPIIWDVGHQAYAHKILTGRKKLFHTNRKLNGISGFPKMCESPYDSFGTGHSSTSISAALGMAIASKLKGDDKKNHIAIIGDGGLTGGMAFEAMNHAGDINPNLLLIFNDNGIAIDENVGALKEYFARITASKTYNRIKTKTWRIFRNTLIQRVFNKVTTGFKSVFLRNSNLFESLNFRYFGPIDGHNIKDLVSMFNDLKVLPGTKVLHIVTKKGKGLKQAERNQTIYHAPGQFDAHTGELIIDKCLEEKPKKYQQVFGKTIVELAEMNQKIIVISPAMISGSSLKLMQRKFPDRTFDVGIAEQHAVTFAAGMAANSFIPFCCIYSSFLQRAYDQIIHDVALQKLPVVFCIDRAGLVGEDGPTHHGQFDLAFLRTVPNLIISAPINEICMRNLMYTAQLQNSGPFVIRYPKADGLYTKIDSKFETLEIGKAKQISKGSDIAVLSIGHIGNSVIEACKLLQHDNISVEHWDMIFLKPIDEVVMKNVCQNFNTVITIEDGTIKGGLASEFAEFVAKNNFNVKHIPCGLPDSFVQHGTNYELFALLGLNDESLCDLIRKAVFEKTTYFCKKN